MIYLKFIIKATTTKSGVGARESSRGQTPEIRQTYRIPGLGAWSLGPALERAPGYGDEVYVDAATGLATPWSLSSSHIIPQEWYHVLSL